MEQYYRDRAPVYDRVYSYPERQTDLRYLERFVPEQFIDKDVIEIAAGTGYWTQYISQKAKSIHATDITEEALCQVQERELVGANVTTQVIDVFNIPSHTKYTGLFAGLWYSHMSKEKLQEFFDVVHSVLHKGSTVLFLDNSRSQCIRLPLSHTDSNGNTYQDRTLDNGDTHRVLKNFPTENELLDSIGIRGEELYFKELEHYWLCKYTCT